MKQYGRDYTTFKFLSHSAGIWRSRCAWQLQVIIIRAQSEEIAISFLATFIELMVPDRFALFFFFCLHRCGHQTALIRICHALPGSNKLMWTKGARKGSVKLEFGATHCPSLLLIPICLQLHPAKPRCECFKHTYRHTGTNTHTHQRAQSLEEKLKRAGPTPTW